MPTIFPYILLIVGFFILIKGADFFVEGSCAIAKKFNIPDIVIGLTIVAMGTSAPELAVSVTAALDGSSEIALGNVVGSNIVNILVVLGLSAVIAPVMVNKSLFKKDFPVLIFISVLLPLLCIIGDNNITRLAGIILLIIFIAYLIWTVKSALDFKKNNANNPIDTPESDEIIKELSLWRSILYTVGGAVVIIVGGNLSVDNAVKIAEQLKISQAVIGLTVVAIGTSLPELVTSVVAAKKGRSDMAIGNVIGSNIFNILLILGATAAIKPFATTFNNLVDQVILLVITIALVIFSITGKNKISRIEGLIFIALYIAYTAYILTR